MNTIIAISVEGDNLGDLSFTLNNNDRLMLRRLIYFTLAEANLDTEDAVELVEFNNRIAQQTLKEMAKCPSL